MPMISSLAGLPPLTFSNASARASQIQSWEWIKVPSRSVSSALYRVILPHPLLLKDCMVQRMAAWAIPFIRQVWYGQIEHLLEILNALL